MEKKDNEQSGLKDHSYVDWNDLEHVQDVEVKDVESLNNKLKELYDMNFVVKIEQLRYKRQFYSVSIFDEVNRYLLKIYKKV